MGHTTHLTYSGLIVAGAVLPDRATNLTLRVLNPTEKVIRLQKGIRCEVEPVAVMETETDAGNPAVCANVRQEEPAEAEEVLKHLWTNVAESVPAP